jgi:DNA-directed RNA polymerase specialized sigma24 family protein
MTPDIYRSVFVLREIETMSTAETSVCQESPEEAVKVRLIRVRPALREELCMRWGS